LTGLAVILIDIRASVDALRRMIIQAQSRLERFRDGREPGYLDDVAVSLAQVTRQTDDLIDQTRDADKVLHVLMTDPSSSAPSGPSGV
jgi:hypothetical protein